MSTAKVIASAAIPMIALGSVMDQTLMKFKTRELHHLESMMLASRFLPRVTWAN